MQVTVKLFATLQRYGPEGVRVGVPFKVTLPEGSTLGDLVAQLGLPEREVTVTFVDGRARPPAFALSPGAEVGIFPPVGGG